VQQDRVALTKHVELTLQFPGQVAVTLAAHLSAVRHERVQYTCRYAVVTFWMYTAVAFLSVQQNLVALVKHAEVVLQVRLQAVATLAAHSPGATHVLRMHVGFSTW
jgi:hypothetical protein